MTPAARAISASVLLLFLLSTALLSVISTYSRLSRTSDEVIHTYAGLEWWQTGRYTRDIMNPPLARIADAAVIHFKHAWEMPREQAFAGMPKDEAYILETTWMRLGTLPFYFISCLLVFGWSWRLFDKATAFWALALFVTLPTVNAHAGVAATDMAYTAMLLAALWAGAEWLLQPDWKRGLVLGVALGLALCTKFSTLAHWPAAMVLITGTQAICDYRTKKTYAVIHDRHLVTGILFVMLPMLLVVGVIYRFHWPSFAKGIMLLHDFDQHGFAIWLFGPLHDRGVWYFFPVVFFFKTPLAFHLATLIGNVHILRTVSAATLPRLFPFMAALGILFASMPSNINLGVRHVLPLYPLLAMGAGYGLHLLWRSDPQKKIAAIMLMLWQLTNVMESWPDHISYYNELAGSYPERISLDSNFDWGQSTIMLDQVLQAHNVTDVYLCANMRILKENASFLLHARVLPCPHPPVSGWIALSRGDHIWAPKRFGWLDAYPAIPIGKTMDLYFIPPETTPDKMYPAE